MPATVLAVVQAAALVALPARLDDRDAVAAVRRCAARARGIPRAAVILSPRAPQRARSRCVAVVMVDAALLVSGAVVTESVFAWPGLGSLFTEALARRDYTVLMALLMLTSTAIVAPQRRSRTSRTR